MINHEKITLKARYITPIITIITFLTLFYGLYKKPYQWDESVKKVDSLAVKSAEHDVTLAIIRTQLQDISSTLKQLNRKIDKMDNND